MSRRKSGLPRFLKGIGFKQVNERWSWGAVDHDRQLVVLFVWADQLLNHEGGRYVEIQNSPDKYREDSRLGRNEREEHIGFLRDGYAGYLVMQTAVDPKASPRIRESYSDRLSTVGKVLELDSGRRLIEITGKVEAKELTPDKEG